MVCDQSKIQYYCTTKYYCCDLDANDGNPINCGISDKGNIVDCSFAQKPQQNKIILTTEQYFE